MCPISLNISTILLVIHKTNSSLPAVSSFQAHLGMINLPAVSNKLDSMDVSNITAHIVKLVHQAKWGRDYCMNSDVSNNFIKRVPTLTFDLSQHSCIPFNQLLHIMRKLYQITFTYHEKILSNQHCYFNLTLSKCQKKILLGVLTLTAFNGWP